MNRTTVNHRRPARLRLGVGMIVASLVGALFAGLGGTASAAEEAKTLEIEQSAYWTHSLGHVAPNALTSRFPPQAVCLVVAQFCGDDAEQVTDADEDDPVPVSINQTVKDNQPEGVVPVSELDTIMAGGPDSGNLPTGVIAGARRYQSAIQFDPPTLADDEQFSKFEVALTTTDPTYHFDSPAFRQFITGVLALIQENTDELPKTPERDPVGEAHLGVEACPITVAWEAGENQDAADAPDRDSFERDAEGNTLEPEIDCGYGANGEEQADGSWIFDLTAAANAWAAGDLPNHGVLLRPVNPPNLAYGDPDLSTWDQVTFAGPGADEGAPTFVAETEEVAPLVTFDNQNFTSGSDSGADVLGTTATQPSSFTEVFGAGEALPADTSEPVADASQGDEFVAAPVAVSNPVTEWWVWLLLPLMLGGMYLVSQGFMAETAVAHERAGAMTRLLAQRRAAGLEG